MISISRQLSPTLWSLSAVEEKRRAFGTASYTEDGIQFNTYLMDSGDGFILLGAPPEQYVSIWLDGIKAIAGENIKWIVLFGTDDDRTAARAVLDIYPTSIVVTGTNGLFKLEGFTGSDTFEKIEIRNSRTLTFGKKELQFQVIQEKFATPCVYVLVDGALFTADAFGSISAAENAFVSEMEDKAPFLRGVEHYLADIFSSKRLDSLNAAVSLAKNSGVNLICPACGPIMDAMIDQVLALSAPGPSAANVKPALALVYAAGDYVKELAQSIAAGASESGEVVVKKYDLSALNRDAVLKELPQADAFLFGTPEVNGDAAKSVWDILTSLQRSDCQGKPAAVFTSGAVQGGAADSIHTRLEFLNCDLNLQDYSLLGPPDVQNMKNAYEYGYGVSCSILKIPNPRKPKLVKCLVCGEIFDASLGICPVCGVGLDQCVPVDEDEVAYRNDTERRYLILGGGIAAVSAAEAIRQRDGTGFITMLSAEQYLPINRPMLTKDLAAIASDPNSIQIHDRAWYDEKKIDLHLGVAAMSLDTQARTVAASDGKTYLYDKLIYATGAECFVPPFDGHDKPCVLTIRHLNDSQELQKRMKTAKKAVVIGGGVLGLEAASELMRAGINVTVLEAAPQIVGRQIDVHSATILKERMEKMGIACCEGVAIAGITGDEQASVVRLGDGREFPADFVIVSCGNRGNVHLAKTAGISVERAIVVNERMETNVPDVYACGDCCQFDGVNFQLWQEASSQGRVAGSNATGDTLRYANQMLGLSLECSGISLFALGDPGKKSDVPYKTVETVDEVSGRREKYWFYGASLEGAVVIGAPEKTVEITQAVTTHARYAEMF